MGSVYLWKLSSQKLGFFLVSFGFIWGMMLLHFTIQQRATHESSAQLRMQILDLSKRYIKALAEENQSVMDGPYVGTMTAYGESLAVSETACYVDISSLLFLFVWECQRFTFLVTNDEVTWMRGEHLELQKYIQFSRIHLLEHSTII